MWEILEKSNNTGSQLAVGLNIGGFLEVFRTNLVDKTVWCDWQNSPGRDWCGWRMLGTSTDRGTELAVGKNLNKWLEVFLADLDKTIWHNQWTGVGWSGWSHLGTTVIKGTGMAVVNNEDGRLEMFLIRTDNHVYHNWQTAPGGEWNGWNILGRHDITGSNLAVGINDRNCLEVFLVGFNNIIYHNEQSAPGGEFNAGLGAGWSGWSELGHIDFQGTSLAVGTNADKRLEVFLVGEEKTIWHNWQINSKGDWSGWEMLANPAITGTSLAVERNENGCLEVFLVGSDNFIYHNWQTSPGGGWSGWNLLGIPGATGMSLAVGKNADQRLEVFLVATDNNIWHISQLSPNNWGPGARLRFCPSINGFKFTNSGFANDFVPSLNIRTQSLCGGMAYTALDYYFSDMPIPNQPFRPANQTPLHNYLYDRQTASIMNNLEKWTELTLGMGTRDGEFFQWGITARIGELRKYLDQGIPCILGFIGGGGWGHQVIAYDYSLGRYKEDGGNYLDEFKIYVYDPNYADTMTTIIADKSLQAFQRTNDPLNLGNWRTYFVDPTYRSQLPPALPNPNYPKDGLVYELVLLFSTGGDDLRGGADNVDLVVNLLDGTQQIFPNINVGGRWIVGSKEYAQVILNKPLRASQLRNLMLSTTCEGGPSPDNWDLTKLQIFFRDGNFSSYETVLGKIFKFGDRVLIVPINPAPGSLGLEVLVREYKIKDDQYFKEDEFAGTRGQERALLGFQISFNPPINGLGMRYKAHVQDEGDTQDWVTDGNFVGSAAGWQHQIEGFMIELTGPLARDYYVEYMAHLQDVGDTVFYKDGAFCGTRGQGRRVEGIQVRVIKKC